MLFYGGNPGNAWSFIDDLQFIAIEEIRLLPVYNNKIEALSIDFFRKINIKDLPRETFATTAAIPMTMPRFVRPERNFALHVIPRDPDSLHYF